MSAAGAILGIETSCDETAAAIVDRGTSVLSSVVSSQVDLHARYGGVVPEIASRAHVDLIVPVVAQAFVEAGLSDRPVDGEGCEVDAVAATYGPGPGGRAARRASRPPRRSRWRGTCRSSPSTTSRRTSTPPSSTSPTSSCRSWCCWCRAATRSSCSWRATASTGCSAPPSTTPPARRSTRSPATSASATPAGRPSTGWRSTGDPEAIRFPRPMLGDGTYDFSFSGLKTAVVNHVRNQPGGGDRRRGGVVPGGGGRRARHQDAWPPPARSGAKGLCLGGGVAANSRLRERFLDACVDRRAPRVPAQLGHVHRQRRHGGQRRLVPLAERRPLAPRHRRPPEPRHPGPVGFPFRGSALAPGGGVCAWRHIVSTSAACGGWIDGAARRRLRAGGAPGPAGVAGADGSRRAHR